MSARQILRTDVEGLLRRLLTEVAGVSADVITADATIDNQLKLESVALVEIQVALEDEYDIEIDVIEIVERNQFSLIVDYIYALAGSRS